MTNMIKQFFIRLENNPNDICFIQKDKQITNEIFLNDILKKISYFEAQNIDGRIIIFSLPSYSFYVSLIALMYLGCEVVIIESFKDHKVLKELVSISNAKYILVNSKTNIISLFIKPFNKLIRIKDNKSGNIDIFDINSINYHKKILYTFSSGTTSYKLIARSLEDLSLQFDLVKSSFNKTINKCVCLMVMYVLVNLINGTICYLPKSFNAKSVNKELKYIKSNNIDTLIASVSKLVNVNNKDNVFKDVYTGGSKINYHDRIKLLKVFGDLTYMYGASEATVISKTTLVNYHENLKRGLNCVGAKVPEVEVKTHKGEILVKTPSVITKDEDGYFHTSDKGYIIEDNIYITGKINYCYNDDISPFIIEDKLNEVYNTSFTYINYNNRDYIIYYKPSLHITKSDINRACGVDYDFIVINKKTKRDIRHNYKQNYNSCINVINKYNKK